MKILELGKLLDNHLVSIKKIAEDTYRFTISSPFVSYNFKFGQIYRFQIPREEEFSLLHQGFKIPKPIPVTILGRGATKDEVFFDIFIHGESTKAMTYLKKGSKIFLVGPVGVPSELPLQNERVLTISSDRGNSFIAEFYKLAVEENLFSYLHVYMYYLDKKYISKETAKLKNLDKVTVLLDIASNPFEKDFESCPPYDRIFVIGNNEFIAKAKEVLLQNKNLFHEATKLIASVAVPMFCMQKGICSKCIQKHGDQMIYSCAMQDQNLLTLDTDFMLNRSGS